jgi:glutamate 5-kinase
MAAINTLEASKRIVIKIGSGLIVDSNGSVRHNWLDNFVSDVTKLRESKKEIIIVTSGAVALGRNLLGINKNIKLKLSMAQCAAASGQIELITAYKNAFTKRNTKVAQLLLTIGDTEERRKYLNTRNTLSVLLENHMVPIINENDTVTTSEIRYGDNDRLAARVTSMSSSDCLVILSDVDGIYTESPKNKNAKHIPIVKKITPEIMAMARDTNSTYGTGGMITKLEAARISTESGAHMIIANGEINNPIENIINGGKSTLLMAKTSPSLARKNWIAGMLEPKGHIYIDSGAKEALKKGRSLLPAGTTKVTGDFERGDAVIIFDNNENEVARGLAAYSIEDAQLIIMKKTLEIEKILGYKGRSALVHIDDLVVTNGDDNG